MYDYAVLGLGNMGRRVANRLAGSGFSVSGWNRTPSTFNTLHNVHLATSLTDAVSQAKTVLLLLHDAASVRDVLFTQGAASALRDGAMVFDMGTNTPSDALQVAERIAPRAVFADAPVSGGTGGAEEGTLSIFLGIDASHYDAARQRLAPLGRTTHMGSVGAGPVAKLANQAIVACGLASLAEGFGAADAMGLSCDTLLSARRGGFAESKLLELMGRRICGEDFAQRGRAATHRKDIDCLMGELGQAGVALEATMAARNHLYGSFSSHGDLDHSGMFLTERDHLASGGGTARP